MEHYLILILCYLKTDTKEQFLYVGGVFPTYPPLVDGINHMPRIDTPFLMLNGEQDYLVPQVCSYVLLSINWNS